MTVDPAYAPPENVYGPLVAGSDVEDHVQEIIARWHPSYLYELERLHGIVPGTLPLIRSMVRSAAIEKFPEDQLPCLMIASPGLTDPPIPDGGGYYIASWRINLAIQVIAGPNRRAQELARWYALVLRSCVEQQQQDPALTRPVHIVRIDWRDENYENLDPINDRTVCIGRVEFAVLVAEVLRRGYGPLEPMIPPQEPGPDAPYWPAARSVLTEVDKDPIVTIPTPSKET